MYSYGFKKGPSFILWLQGNQWHNVPPAMTDCSSVSMNQLQRNSLVNMPHPWNSREVQTVLSLSLVAPFSVNLPLCATHTASSLAFPSSLLPSSLSPSANLRDLCLTVLYTCPPPDSVILLKKYHIYTGNVAAVLNEDKWSNQPYSTFTQTTSSETDSIWFFLQCIWIHVQAHKHVEKCQWRLF